MVSSMFCRIKEELGGPEHSQAGWQRFRQLTAQFSAGQICSGCYLSSFLSLFPEDPQRRTTEVNHPAAPFYSALPHVFDAFFQAALPFAARTRHHLPHAQQRRPASSVRGAPSLCLPFPRVLRADVASRLLSCGHCCLCRYMHIIRSFAGGRDAAPATGSGIANALDDDRLQSLEDMRAHWPSVVDLALNAFPGA